jgi:ABC-type Fe3+-hydroxamate transport system substrate-binding protein
MFRCAVNLIIGLVLVLMYSGCQRRSPSNSTLPPRSPATQASQAASRPAVEVRIVSLSPAISRTLVDFSLQSKVVGRTPYCYSLDKSIPVVGDLTNVNFEQLVELNPTHILVQPPAAGLNQNLVQVAREHGWTLAAWPLTDLDDIEKLVGELPAALFPDGSAELEQAAHRSAELLNRIAQAVTPSHPGTSPLWTGRVLIVSSINPVLAAGRGTFLSDVVTRLGSANALAATGWVQLSMEDVVQINPEALIVVKPGFDKLAGVGEAAGPLWNLEIDASLHRRVCIVNNWDAYLPSSAITATAEEIRSQFSILAGGSQSQPEKAATP